MRSSWISAEPRRAFGAQSPLRSSRSAVPALGRGTTEQASIGSLQAQADVWVSTLFELQSLDDLLRIAIISIVNDFTVDQKLHRHLNGG